MSEPAGNDAYFIDRSGNTVAVPAEQTQTAAENGYVPASPEQIEQFHREVEAERRFGGVGGALAAGAAGAARAATLGLSDIALTKTGAVAPETLKTLEDVQPIASGAGTALGIVAPALLTGGASAVAEGGAAAAAESGAGALARRGAAALAEASAPSLVSRAGRAVEGLAARALPQAESTVGQIVNKAIATGAGSAIEGAAYGLGNVVSEAALGDPNLTGDSIAAEIGLSALLGGGLGAVAGGAGGALSHLVGKAGETNFGAKLADWLGEVEGERNIKAAGAIQSDISRTTKQIGKERLKELGQEMGELGLVTPFSTPAKTLERAEAMLDSTGREIGSFLEKIDAKAAPEARANVVDLLSKAEKEILEPLAQNPLQQGAANYIKSALDGYLERFATADGSMALRDLHGMRREISEALYGLRGNQDPFANATKDALHDLRSMVSDEINSSIDRAGASSDEWKALNRRFEVAKRAEEFAQKGVDRAHGNNLVSPTELLGGLTGIIHGGAPAGIALGAATAAARRYSAGVIGAAARAGRELIEDGAAEAVVNKTAKAIADERAAGTNVIGASATQAPETVAALAELERAQQRVNRRIEDGISMVVRASVRAAHVGRGEVAAGVAKTFAAAPEDSSKRFAKRQEQILRLTSNPDLLHGALTQQVDDLNDHAPNTAQAMQIASARGVAFLASKLPRYDKPGPLGPKLTPSPAEIAKFNRYFEAVENPTSILKQAAAGTLTPEAVEAVRTVYPNLYGKIQQSLVEKLSSFSGSVPYSNRLMLSLLSGSDVDGTTAPSSIRANQASLTGPSAKSADRAPSATSQGLGGLTLSSRLQTPYQASLQRR